MDELNPDLFESLPFWLPRTRAAADWLLELDAIDVLTCSLEALRQLALAAPSLQAVLWLLHIYFSRMYADEQNFLRHFKKIDFQSQIQPEPLLIEFLLGDSPNFGAWKLIHSLSNKDLPPPTPNSELGM